MKNAKWITKILSLLLVVTLVISMAGCSMGGENSSSESSQSESSESSVSEESTESSEESSASEESVAEESSEASEESQAAEGLTLKDYLQDPSFLEQMDQMKSQLEGTGQSLEVFEENGSLVYEYIFGGIDLSDETVKQTVKDSLTSTMDTMSGTFESIADTLQGLLKDDSITVIVRYLTEDGEVLFEAEYDK